MLRGFLVATALVAGGLLAGSAEAETLQSGRSTYLHHHHHAAHHYHMTHRHHAHSSRSAGASHDGRTTATGGNAGGYSDKN